MLRSTFQLGPGLGAGREQRLWQAGFLDWSQIDCPLPASIGPAVANRLRAAVARAEHATAEGDAETLAQLVPPGEHWRLYPAFAGASVCLDIETDQEGVTAVGLLDARGPRILLAGRDLDRLPAELAGARLVITFNGGSFDLPVLRRVFPGWLPPPLHVDLRHLWRRLGHHGGLKALEEAQGIGRPDHLRGVTGFEAIGLWRRAQWGDVRALRLFAEYNLYDTINLRTLLDLAHNRMVQRLGIGAPRPVAFRGDVLYDVSKALLAL